MRGAESCEAPGCSIRRMQVRPGIEADLDQINALYNHYIRTSHCTFDVAELDLAWRRDWFARFAPRGRYRLVVTEVDGSIAGFASSGRFRDKQAYETSIETSVYVAPGCGGRGIGATLYAALFTQLAGEDVHRAYAGIALPNPASIALHERFGFHRAGLFQQQGRKMDRYWDVAWYEKSL